MDLANYAANLLLGNLPSEPIRQEFSPVNAAVIKLRQSGHRVAPSDIPGLWEVSGYPELTTGQLLSIASPALYHNITVGEWE